MSSNGTENSEFVEKEESDSTAPEKQLIDMGNGSEGKLLTGNGSYNEETVSSDSHDKLVQMVVELNFQNEYLKSQMAGLNNFHLYSDEHTQQKGAEVQEHGAHGVVKELQEQIESLRRELLEERQTCNAAEEALKHLREVYSEADSKDRELTAKLAEAQQKLDQEIKERDEKNSELDSKLNRLHKRAKQRIQEVQKEKDDLQAQFNDVNEKAERASSQLSALQQELEHTRQQANEALKAIDAERQQLQSANNKLRYNIEELRRSLAPKENVIETMQQSLLEKEQNNKLRSCCQIPSWICCNLEGNDKDMSNDEFISSAEMDVVECVPEESLVNSLKGSYVTTLSHSSAPSSNHKCFSTRKSKGWKRHYSLHQKARQERLNSSRKWKSQNHIAIRKAAEVCLAYTDDSFAKSSSTTLVQEINDKELFSEDVDCQISIASIEEDDIKKDFLEGKCSCDSPESVQLHMDRKSDCEKHNDISSSLSDATSLQDGFSQSGTSSNIQKSKRHSDAEPDNPKPSKYRRPTDNQSDISCKLSRISYCAIDDYLSDGFYDAGRDRPFLPLSSYEKNLPGSYSY